MAEGAAPRLGHAWPGPWTARNPLKGRPLDSFKGHAVYIYIYMYSKADSNISALEGAEQSEVEQRPRYRDSDFQSEFESSFCQVRTQSSDFEPFRSFFEALHNLEMHLIAYKPCSKRFRSLFEELRDV